MGVSFSAGTSPAVGKPSFELGDDEMELGLGIHGEPGVCRTRVQPADQLTETLLEAILKHRPGAGKRVAVMINNLGATTEMELAIVARHVVPFLEEKGILVERLYAGTFISSLDMAGLSISVLDVNDLWLQWLDAPTGAPAWVNAFRQQPGKAYARETSLNLNVRTTDSIGPHSRLGRAVKRAIQAACDALVQGEGALTEMDRIVGDGDLGVSMKRASMAAKQAIDSYPLDDIPSTFKALSHTLSHELGGSSGPLYGVFFLRLGSSLEPSGLSDIDHWAGALQQASAAITELGGAKAGDRTMLDALDAFVQELKGSSAGEAHERLLGAVAAAQRGADATANMTPRLGRSSYLRDRVLGHPDPGAEAVALWLRAAVTAVLQD
jgi:dihydroxyacetone kinase